MGDAIADQLAADIESELTLCRQIFERLPDDILDWKPHPKSPTTGGLAAHIADIAEWVTLAATTLELDYAVKSTAPHQPDTTKALLDYFDARAAGAAAAVRNLDRAALQTPWTVRMGPRIFFSRPREHVIRVDSVHHIVHHRGQLTIYCRLRDVVLPGVYGPNGSE